MIQDIGIRFGAKDVDTVINAFNQIDERMALTMAKMDAFASNFKSMGIAATGALNTIGKGWGDLRGKTQSVAENVRKVSNAMLDASKHGEKLKGVVNAFGNANKKGGMFGDLGKALPYMIQWRAISGAIDAGKYLFNDILGARSRKDMAGALGELSAVSFSGTQKGQAEINAREYSSKFADTQSTDVIKAMSQTASAFSVKELGISMITRMNEAAIHAAKLSKMPEEAMAELLSKFTNSYLATMDKATYNALQGGGRADVRGYGQVNLGEMYQKNAAMIAKTVEVSNIWGKQIGDFMQYAAPVAAQRGWDTSTMLAWSGVMADMGFKGAKAGRAEKSMLLDQADSFAALMGWYEGTHKTGLKGKAKKTQKEREKLGTARVNEAMSDPKKWAEFLRGAVPAIQAAMSAMKTEGLDIPKEFGFSKEFLPQFLSKMNEGALERFDRFLELIRNADWEGLERMRKDQVADTGYAHEKLGIAWDRLVQSIAKGENAITRSLAGLANVFNWAAKQFEKGNTADDIKKELTKTHSRWEEERKSSVDKDREYSPGQYTAQRGPVALAQEADKLLKQLYDEKVKTLPALPKDATPSEVEIRKRKVQEMWDDVNKVKEEVVQHIEGLSDKGIKAKQIKRRIADWSGYSLEGATAPPNREKQIEQIQRENKLDTATQQAPNIQVSPSISAVLSVNGHEIVAAVKNIIVNEIKSAISNNLSQFGNAVAAPHVLP